MRTHLWMTLNVFPSKCYSMTTEVIVLAPWIKCIWLCPKARVYICSSENLTPLLVGQAENPSDAGFTTRLLLFLAPLVESTRRRKQSGKVSLDHDMLTRERLRHNLLAPFLIGHLVDIWYLAQDLLPLLIQTSLRSKNMASFEATMQWLRRLTCYWRFSGNNPQSLTVSIELYIQKVVVSLPCSLFASVVPENPILQGVSLTFLPELSAARTLFL